MATDKNVKIVIGGTTYYFPACHVYRRLNKIINEIPLPRESEGFDLLMASDVINVTGEWLDDTASEYDAKTAFQRYSAFFTAWKSTGGKGTFTWGSGPHSETFHIMARNLDADKESGEGSIMTYNFEFAIVKAPEE
jgi:hypothetical protein